MSHAASAFFCSPFEEAAILTVDGVGEWTSATMGHGRASWEDGALNKIALTHEQRFPHSLGLLYSAFTAFLGFRVNEGEYKVMGISPYGEPRYVDKTHKLFKVYEDGSFWLDMDYFSFYYSSESTFNRNFVAITM
jgi:carbamoyltransferase